MPEIYSLYRPSLDKEMLNKLFKPEFFTLLLLIMLASCAGNDSGIIVYSGSDGSADATGSDADGPESLEETLGNISDPFVRQRILADMLYEARLAYEDNRLLSPAGNNAYEGFRAILDFEPDNEVALQGIRDIVVRYTELADAATRLGQYDSAESYLNRAAGIGVNFGVITDARQRLEQARKTRMEIFVLDPDALTSRSLEIMVELGDIGQHIRNIEAVFLINARTDEEGRWIYKTMREAVGGSRLRGNIGIASEPSIQVVIP